MVLDTEKERIRSTGDEEVADASTDSQDIQQAPALSEKEMSTYSTEVLNENDFPLEVNLEMEDWPTVESEKEMFDRAMASETDIAKAMQDIRNRPSGQDFVPANESYYLESADRIRKNSAAIRSTFKMQLKSLDSSYLQNIARDLNRLETISEDDLRRNNKLRGAVVENTREMEELISNEDFSQSAARLSDDKWDIIEALPKDEEGNIIVPEDADAESLGIDAPTLKDYEIVRATISKMEENARVGKLLADLNEAAKSQNLRQINRGHAKDLVEFLQVIAPTAEIGIISSEDSEFGGSYGLKFLMNEVFGEFEGLDFGGITYNPLTIGKELASLSGKIRRLPEDKQAELLQKAIEVIYENRDAENFTGSNDIILEYVVDIFNEALTTDKEGQPVMATALALQAIGDYTIVGGVLARLARTGVSAVAPFFRRGMDKSSYDNNLVSFFTDEDIASYKSKYKHVLLGETVAAAPNSPQKIDADMLHVIDFINSKKGIDIPAEKRAEILEHVRDVFSSGAKSQEAKGIKYNEKQSGVDIDGDVIRHTSVYNLDTKFKREAHAIANRLFGHEADKKLFKDSNGFWVVRREDSIDFSKQTAALVDLGIDSNIVGAVGVNRWTSGIALPESQISSELLGISSLYERSSNELRSILSEMLLKPLSGLSRKEVSQLGVVLNQYNGKEIPAKVWDNLSPETKVFYDKHYRKTMDLMWLVDNKAVRDEAKIQGKLGFKYSQNGETFTGIGKVVDTNTKVRAYNPVSKTVEEVDIQALKADGHKVFKLEEADAHGFSAEHIIVRSDGDVSITDLPVHIHAYLPNYTPRMYDKHYYITATDKDGKERVLYGTDSLRDAEEVVANTPGSSFRYAREVDHLDKEVNRTSVYKSNRLRSRATEEGLTDFKGDTIASENPLNSALDAVANFANRHTLTEHIDTLKDQFMKTYGHLLPHAEKGYPQQKFLANRGEGYVEARELWKHIARMEGTLEAKDIIAWKQGVLKFGDWAERVLGVDGTSKNIHKIFGGDPSSLGKGLAFYTLLALNPSRQWLMQGQHSLVNLAQHPSLALELPSNIAIGSGIVMSHSFKSKASYKAAEAFARTIGIDKADFKRYYNAFENMGFNQHLSRDMHQYTDSFSGQKIANPVQSLGEKAAASAKSLALFVPEAGKSIGFNVGEGINLAGAYMTAVTKYEGEVLKAAKDAGKSLKRSDIDLSSQEAQKRISELTGSSLWWMSGRAGTSGYSRGTLGALTQFWSIQHKGLASLLPVSLGGRSDLNKTQKALVGSFMFTNYGLEGLGLAKFVDRLSTKVLDDDELSDLMDDRVYSFMKTGLFSEFIARAAGLDSTNMPGSFSATSNTLVSEFMFNFDINRGLEQALSTGLYSLGVGTPAFSAADRYITAGKGIFRAMRYESLDTPEKMRAALSEIKRISPQLTHLEKYELVKEFGIQLSSSGAYSAEDVDEYGIIAAIFGLSDGKTQDAYQMYTELINKVQSMPQSERDKSVQQSAKEWLDRFTGDMLRYKGFVRGSEDFDKILEIEMSAHISKYLPEESQYRQDWADAVRKEMNSERAPYYIDAIDKVWHEATNYSRVRLLEVLTPIREFAAKTGDPEVLAILDDIYNFIDRQDLDDEELKEVQRQIGF